MDAPTRDELDRMIRTRLANLGIDISKLPERDPQPNLPVTQEAVLKAVRDLIASSDPGTPSPVEAIMRTEFDPQRVLPALYPIDFQRRS